MRAANDNGAPANTGTPTRAYYNEIDPFAAQWLRNLIDAGHIAPGDVDERSIVDVRPSDLAGYTQCHFFAGIGIWSAALRSASWSDTTRIWTASCPCQPFSAAGKGSGFDDERHLWPALQWLIQQCRPDRIFGEQVASKDGLAWLDLVSTDLEAMGYACGAVPSPAAGIGAPHIRQRLYWLADATTGGRREERADAGRHDVGDRAEGRAAGLVSGVGAVVVADANSERHNGIDTLLREEAARRDAGDIPEAAGCSDAGRLAESNVSVSEQPAGARARPIQEAGAGTRSQSDVHGDFSGVALGDANDSGLAIRQVAPFVGGVVRHERSAIGAPGALRGQITNGFWSDADWIWCRDGKYRPIEPGSFPLAHGLARGMGTLGPELRRLAEVAGLDGKSLARAKKHRIGSLKGYGNAIVKQQATEFIRAYCEAIGTVVANDNKEAARAVA